MSDATTIHINGRSTTTACTAGTSLLSLLRQLGYSGVRRVCETGDCGACTVWVDDIPIHSCLYPAKRAHNHTVTTIEGLAPDGQRSPLQQAFLEHQGFQCGFCTPGMVMTAAKITYQSEADLRWQLRGNLCRCTGYTAIVESILAGKESGETEESGEPNHLKLRPTPHSPRPTPHSPLPTSHSPQIGQSIPKQDGPEIVTGQPVYTADWAPPGLLHLKVVRSPHPHARIRQIDTSRATALPGVHLVLTHADVPRRAYTTAGHAEPVPDPLDHFLLDTKVRFVGDRVAAVVAESVAIAEQACQLIQVDYEILPHVLDPIAAMGRRQAEPDRAEHGDLREDTPHSPLSTPHSPLPPVIHDELDAVNIPDALHNIAGQVVLESGDLEAGFAAADLVIETTYSLPPVQHAHLEPHTTTSWLEPDGMLVVRSSTQVPFHCQRMLSELFDLPREKIRVYKAKLGGGFGNKQEILSEDLCVLATLRTGRPVQWVFTRQEEFACTNSRHAMTIRLKTGVKADGTLIAQDMEAIANTGAYGNHGGTVVFLAGYEPLGLYRCAHKRYRGYAVYTNTMPAGAFRGYGATQGCFAMESQLDEIARKLAIDPVDLRRKNMIRPDDVITLGRSADHFNLIGSYAVEECFTKVITAMGYVPGVPPVVNGARRRGVSISLSMQGSGLSKVHLAGVKLTLNSDGRFCLRSGSVDVGTGSDTTLRQIAAHVLGVTVGDIDMITADTHQTPFDAGSYASATLYISGQSTRQAAEKLRDRIVQAAAPLLQAEPDTLTIASGIIASSDQSMSFQALVAALQVGQGEEGKQREQGDSLTLPYTPHPTPRSARLTSRHTPHPLLEAENNYAANESSLTFAVQGVEVEVDTETGKVQVLQSVQAIDLGIAINPRICLGQATGGSAMGIGYALTEELRMDDRGTILNPSFRTYRLPTAAEMPPMTVFLVEQADPYGPFGAKGVGEITTNGMAPAIANAIAHATGVRLTDLPMTPERVWTALQAQKAPKFSATL